MNSTQNRKIAIIGAGLAGVGCATALTEAGVDVTVFEKSRGLGGRCATKRWAGYCFDHGAQFFTLRSLEFASRVNEACGPSLIEIGAPVISELGNVITPESPRFYHRAGNSRLARDLSEKVNVTFEVEMDSVKPATGADKGKWIIANRVFDEVITTAPWPQTARLFNIADAGPSYHPCLTLLLLYRTEWLGNSRQRYAVSDQSGHPLMWSACENHKESRVASGFTGMVVQASAEFSDDHFEAPAEAWTAELRRMTEERWNLPESAFVTELAHRWRYARIATPTLPPPQLPPGLHYVGDGVTTRSRVESSWLAGMALGEQLARHAQAGLAS